MLIDIALPSSSYFVCVSDAYDLKGDNSVNVTYHCVENTAVSALDVITYNTIAVCVSHCAENINAVKGQSFSLPYVPSKLYGNMFAKVQSSVLQNEESLLVTSKEELKEFYEKFGLNSNDFSFSLLDNAENAETFFEENTLAVVAVRTGDNTTAEIINCDVSNGICRFNYCLIKETGYTDKRECME